jgi:hypothetical protein
MKKIKLCFSLFGTITIVGGVATTCVIAQKQTQNHINIQVHANQTQMDDYKQTSQKMLASKEYTYHLNVLGDSNDVATNASQKIVSQYNSKLKQAESSINCERTTRTEFSELSETDASYYAINKINKEMGINPVDIYQLNNNIAPTAKDTLDAYKTQISGYDEQQIAKKAEFMQTTGVNLINQYQLDSLHVAFMANNQDSNAKFENLGAVAT